LKKIQLITMNTARQQGVALIATLMVILVVAVLGIAIINRTLSAKKIDTSIRDMEAACLAAESALRRGEVRAKEPYKKPYDTPLLPGQPWITYPDAVSAAGASWYKGDWIVSGAIPLTNFNKISGASATLVSADPFYKVEKIEIENNMLGGMNGAPGGQHEQMLFRVTARGSGRTGDTICMRQSLVTTVDRRK